MHMRDLGLNGDVTCNKTILDGRFENGCRALVVGPSAKEDAWRLWKRLEATQSLRCAHVDVGSRVSGCVYDVYRESSCPDAG